MKSEYVWSAMKKGVTTLRNFYDIIVHIGKGKYKLIVYNIIFKALI